MTIAKNMEFLPDELWLQAVQIGVQSKSLGHLEICRLAMVSRRFRRLFSLDSVWKGLWEAEFGCAEGAAGTSKGRKRTKAEKDAPDWKAAYQIRSTPMTFLCCLTVFSENGVAEDVLSTWRLWVCVLLIQWAPYRYESFKSALRMSHMRVVLAAQSEIAGLQYDCNNLQRSIDTEKSKLSTLCVDHSHIKHAR